MLETVGWVWLVPRGGILSQYVNSRYIFSFVNSITIVIFILFDTQMIPMVDKCINQLINNLRKTAESSEKVDMKRSALNICLLICLNNNNST